MLCLSKDADKLIQLQSWEPTKKQSQILREGSIFLKRKTTKSRCNTWRPWQNDRMRGGCGVSWSSRCDGCSVLADAGWCWHCSRHTWPIRQSVRRRQHGPAPASWPANTTSHLQSQPSPQYWPLSTLISTNVLRYISFHSYCCINCSIRAQPGAHIPGMVHVILSNFGWNWARVRMRLRWNKMSACPPVEVLRKLAGHSPGLIPHNETQLWLFTGPHYKGLNEAFELKSTDDYT